MNIIEVFNAFQMQEQAVEYLEKMRWNGQPVCPYCQSKSVGRHASGDRQGQRWQCRSCTRAFAATVGTIFHGTHIPLRNWFLCIALMLNAKKSASAYQIARDLGMRRPTVWSMMHRVRVAMANDRQQSTLLHRIVQADETYVGASRRRPKDRGDGPTGSVKRGRGTPKKPVTGVMESGERVVACPAKPGELGTKNLSKFHKHHVDKEGTLLVAAEWSDYNRFRESYLDATVHHAVKYANGLVRTSSIERFCGLVKRAWCGSHHHCSEKYMAVYITEACYKFNQRLGAPTFNDSIALFVNVG